MDKIGDADELSGKFDGDGQAASAAQDPETVLSFAQTAHVREVALHLFEVRPVAFLDHGGPLLEGSFRLRVRTDKFLQRLFCEDSHGANIIKEFYFAKESFKSQNFLRGNKSIIQSGRQIILFFLLFLRVC
jgi:hypothetical protein